MRGLLSWCLYSLPAGFVLGTAAERHADHTAGEGHEESVVVLVQLQAKDTPVLPTDVTPSQVQQTTHKSVRWDTHTALH